MPLGKDLSDESAWLWAAVILVGVAVSVFSLQGFFGRVFAVDFYLFDHTTPISIFEVTIFYLPALLALAFYLSLEIRRTRAVS